MHASHLPAYKTRQNPLSRFLMKAVSYSSPSFSCTHRRDFSSITNLHSLPIP